MGAARRSPGTEQEKDGHRAETESDERDCDEASGLLHDESGILRLGLTAVGTVVAGLPGACSSISIGGVSYMNCAGVFYMPFYSGGALMYQVAQP